MDWMIKNLPDGTTKTACVSYVASVASVANSASVASITNSAIVAGEVPSP